MAVEDHNGERSSQGVPTGIDHSLDSLARDLANGSISRRKALRLMGGVLLGGTLASIPGVALAQQGGNRACVRFCKQVFPPGRERGQCISQGARGRGPCYSCTPGIGPGPHFTPQCGPNEEFNPETCECEAVGCSPAGSCDNALSGCDGDPECVCFETVEGGGFCHRGQPCEGSQSCATSADCPAGYACSAVTCCGPEPICIQPCAGTGDQQPLLPGPTTTGR
jgi:hypothetical protein